MGSMDLAQWYVRRGRINRQTYWLHYVLPLAGLTILATLADVSFGHPLFSVVTTSGGDVLQYDPGPVSTVLFVLTFVPSISSQATRLHDRGLPAWWLAIALVPVVGVLVLFLVCGFLAGEPRPNRYGPPPGQPVPDAGWPQDGQPLGDGLQASPGQPSGHGQSGPHGQPPAYGQPAAHESQSGYEPPRGPEDDPRWGQR